MNNNVVGIYYELPDGRIVYTYGFDDLEKTVYYFFDDDTGQHKASYNEFNTWKPRKDLYDFPNARDPRLPYVFDLLWDIKYMSDLRRELRGHRYEKEIRLKMKKHAIDGI